MKPVIKIDRKEFIEWYFNSGADQDQRDMRYNLGNDVVDGLLSEGAYVLNHEHVWDDVGYIPFTLIKNLDECAEYLKIEGYSWDVDDLYRSEIAEPASNIEVEWIE